MNDQARPPRVRVGASSFDPARAELLGPHGEPVHLRPQSMRVLETLLAHSGTVVTREALVATVWPGVVVTDDSLVQCVRDIRRALGADHSLLHTVPRVGYRLDLPPSSAAVVDQGHDRPRWASAWVIGGLGVAVALLAAGWLHTRGGASIVSGAFRQEAVVAARDRTVALRIRYDAPPSSLKESDIAFAAGTAHQIVADVLAGSTALRAVAMPGSASDATATDLTQRLGARFLLDGRVKLLLAGVALTVDLVDTSTAAKLWSVHSESTVAQLASDRASLLRRVAESLHAPLRSADAAPPRPAASRSIEVYQLVTRAQGRADRLDRADYRAAREELAQALRIEPDLAMGWAVLGYLDAVDATAGITGDMTTNGTSAMLDAAERSIALDPRLSLAHQARALGLVVRRRHVDALVAAEYARSQSPSDPHGSLVLANALVSNGRMAEASAAIEQAQSRFAATPAIFDFVHAKVLWGNDRFDESVDAASRCLEKAPGFAACRAIRAVASDSMSRLEAARDDLKAYRLAVPGPATDAMGPGSYGVPKLQNNWLSEIRGELGLP